MKPGLVDLFEEHAESLMAVQPDISTEVIRRSMAIKANVVSQDERETLGIRILLNYGHTIGHALEASTEYGRFLHGEGVSIGMMGAARIAREMGILSNQVVDRQRRLLERFRLPTRATGVPVDAVLRAMSLDKKAVGSSLRWVLLQEVGRSTTNGDVPMDLALEVLQGLAG
jgi:3-dehydroquinate synthetase